MPQIYFQQIKLNPTVCHNTESSDILPLAANGRLLGPQLTVECQMGKLGWDHLSPPRALLVKRYSCI